MNIKVTGGGLAGCEAAWYLAERGHSVSLYEMRPLHSSPAHVTEYLGELVCSNSLKSENPDAAAGLLKAELRHYGSLMMQVAEQVKVPAGAALAVDRDKFAAEVSRRIAAHPNIYVLHEKVANIVSDVPHIVACGPLPHPDIEADIFAATGEKLHFIDAISPVISADSIDMNTAFFAGRYGKGGDDYLNLPLSEEEFDAFYTALMEAEVMTAHEFEDVKAFERCMPIEVMGARGRDTLLYGPMRPVGLTDPRTGRRPFAAVQLRLENMERTAYNIVGFQTKMTYPAQRKVLRMLPGLENADFLRYGTLHRNTYIDAPSCLTSSQMLKNSDNIYFAGQVTGVEGYLESMASGMMAAMQLDNILKGNEEIIFDRCTAFGALQRHIAGDFGGGSYSPGGFHFGMLPPFEKKIRCKQERKLAYTERALAILRG